MLVELKLFLLILYYVKMNKDKNICKGDNIMSLFDAIYKRKASRQFLDKPLEEKELNEMLETLKGFELLYSESPLEFRMVSHTKGLFNVDAPHYLIISGQGREYEQLNAGYVGERFVLWLHTKGIGSVWQGASKDAGEGRSKYDLIVIAFGKSEIPIERKLEEFKRKDINEITNIPDDECLKAVHVAPSGINIQPWYFEKVDNKIVVYEQKLKPPLSFLYKTTAVDMGIALCHYALACEHYNKLFSFKPVNGKSNKRGFKLFGELT